MNLILYVDDEQTNLDVFRRNLDDEMAVLTATSGAEAYGILERESIAVLLSDHRMPGVTGVELLATAAQRWPHTSRILLTAYNDRELILHAIRDGRVHDYILKPWVLDDLRLRLARAIEAHVERTRLLEASFERDALLQDAGGPADGGAFVGLDAGLRGLAPVLPAIANSPAPALIYGEPGSGRRMLAHEIHRLGPRREGPFVLLRCGGGRGDLARRLHGSPAEPGALRRARRGSLHLADVDKLALAEQRTLCAALQDGIDAGDRDSGRVTASASRPIDAMVALGRFDRNLATLLAVHTIEVPPLRRHLDDVAALAQRFLDFQNQRLGARLRISSDAIAALRSYDWPGNARELRNVVERAAALADPDTELEREDFVLRLDEEATAAPSVAQASSIYEEIEREEVARLRAALKQALGNKARAARILGVARTTLNDRLRKHGLD